MNLNLRPGSFVDQTLIVSGVDLAAAHQRYIVDGEILRLAETTFGACGTVLTVTQPVFDYGMTGHVDDEGLFVIDTVDLDGPAAPAGFKVGMVMLKRLEGAFGDATVGSVLRVELKGVVQDLRYLPTNGEMLTLQRIEVDESNGSDACAELLGGHLPSL